MTNLIGTGHPATQATDQTVAVRESRPKAAVRLAGSLAIVAVGAWGGMTFPVGWPTIALGAGVAFFVFAAVRYTWTLIHPGYLRISRCGIEIDQGWRKRSWPWGEIENVWVITGRTRFASAVMIGFKGDRDPIGLFNWEIPPTELKVLLDARRGPGPT